MMGQNLEFYQKLFHERDYLSAFYDATLQTEDGWTFYVHRVSLAPKSRFFHDLFCYFPNDREPTLLPKFRGETLNEILYFLYTDAVAFNRHNFLDIMIASDFLQIDELYNRATKFAESLLSTENCLRVYVTSKKINEVRLRELSFRIIQTNFEKLKNEAEFAEFSVEYLVEILKDNSLQVTGENVIWEFIMEWVGRDSPNRFKEVCYLLKCLKLGDIDESLANEIIQSDIIVKNPYFGGLKEVALQKFESSLDALKKIINSCLESPEISLSDSRRLPECIHIIFHRRWEMSDIRFYITYDEKLDLYRNLGEFETSVRLLNIHILGENIYAFDDFTTMIFNVCEQEWVEIENDLDGLQEYILDSLAVGRKVYFITSSPVSDDDEGIVKIRIYNTENDSWSDAMPALRVSDYCEAVSLLNKIFLIQETENGPFSILIKVYDEESNSWSSITPPSVDRVDFHSIAYHEKLYIIGGTDLNGQVNTVEVLDVARNEWEIIDDLPLVHQDLELNIDYVFTFKDQLFVILRGGDGMEILKKFVLNETTWVEPEKQFSADICRLVSNKHLKIRTVYDKQIISVLVKQSRLSETILEHFQ